VFFVVCEIVFIEELAEFFLKGFYAVVFALILDVDRDGVELRFAEGESAVAGLP